MLELQKAFKSEFLNRVDEIVMFNSLSKDTLGDIIDKIIIEVEKRLSDKHIKISITDKAKKYILDNAYDAMYGARPIRRYISKNIETLIAHAIINDVIENNMNILIDIEKEINKLNSNDILIYIKDDSFVIREGSK